jgi:hypothetical protein
MSLTPHPFRVAVESRDLDAMAGTLADDVVLWSPLAFEPFRGKLTVMRLLDVLMTEVFEDFHYTDELGNVDAVHGLVFRARIGAREVQGLDLLRHDESGRIGDFTVMVRPATALQALAEAVGPHYASIVAR